jgi:hypothetical protein
MKKIKDLITMKKLDVIIAISFTVAAIGAIGNFILTLLHVLGKI